MPSNATTFTHPPALHHPFLGGRIHPRPRFGDRKQNLMKHPAHVVFSFAMPRNISSVLSGSIEAYRIGFFLWEPCSYWKNTARGQAICTCRDSQAGRRGRVCRAVQEREGEADCARKTRREDTKRSQRRWEH